MSTRAPSIRDVLRRIATGAGELRSFLNAYASRHRARTEPRRSLYEADLVSQPVRVEVDQRVMSWSPPCLSQLVSQPEMSALNADASGKHVPHVCHGARVPARDVRVERLCVVNKRDVPVGTPSAMKHGRHALSRSSCPKTVERFAKSCHGWSRPLRRRPSVSRCPRWTLRLLNASRCRRCVRKHMSRVPARDVLVESRLPEKQRSHVGDARGVPQRRPPDKHLSPGQLSTAALKSSIRTPRAREEQAETAARAATAARRRLKRRESACRLARG